MVSSQMFEVCSWNLELGEYLVVQTSTQAEGKSWAVESDIHTIVICDCINAVDVKCVYHGCFFQATKFSTSMVL